MHSPAARPLLFMAGLFVLVQLLQTTFAFEVPTNSSVFLCHQPELPKSLNIAGFLEQDGSGEVHIHEEYLVQSVSVGNLVSFRVKKEALFRLYVAPHKLDVDVYLRHGDTILAHSSLGVDSEEVIAVDLPASSDANDHYEISFHYINLIADARKSACLTMTLELAIVPKDDVQARTSHMNCPSSEKVPTISFESLKNGRPFSFSSLEDKDAKSFNIHRGKSSERSEIAYVHGYTFELSAPTLARGLWVLEAHLGFDFVIGGSIGMFITSGKAETPDLHSCWGDHKCAVATAEMANDLSIRKILAPGTHTLWLYDAVGEKTYTGCIPFSLELSFEQVDEEENFLNCPGKRLPDSFDTPGFIDLTGRMHYREKVFFDVSAMKKVIRFNGAPDSVFRFYLLDTDVDIDLALYKKDTTNLVASTFGKENEEGIVYYIPPDGEDTYEIHIIRILNDGANLLFCPTFNIEVSIIPASDFAYTCPFEASKPPDLSKMQDKITKSPHYFEFSDNRLGYNINQTDLQVTLLEKEFTAPSSLRIFVETTFEFALGSVEVSLYEKTSKKLLSSSAHLGNRNVLDYTVQPGTYKLVLKPSQTQSIVQPEVASFFTCVMYSLRIIISSADSFPLCSLRMKLPEDLNIPGFLTPGKRAHVVSDFDVPDEETQTTSIIVDEPSVLRIRIDQALFSVGAEVLSKSGTVYKKDISSSETSLLVFMDADVKYDIKLSFAIGDGVSRGDCLAYRMELAVYPESDFDFTQKRCTDKLPPSGYLTPKSDDQEATFESFRYTQSSSNLKHTIPLVLREHMGFRLVMTTNFGTSGIAARLVLESGSNLGTSISNGRVIPTTILSPGSYSLEIYESDVMPTKHRHCVEFTISFALVKASSATDFDENDYFTCRNQKLPSTLDSPSYLSSSSGGSVHFLDRFIVHKATETISFKLTATSLLRFYTPAHPGINVDMTLYKGTSASPGDIIATRASEDPETIFVQLVTGDYHFRTFNRPISGSILPPAGYCYIIPFEMAISPLTSLTSDSTLVTCKDKSPPSTIKSRSKIDESFAFTRKASVPFEHAILFTITTEATLDMRLTYRFLPGHLTLSLEGSANTGLSNPVHIKELADISYNQAFARRGLSPGDYKIIIREPESAASLPGASLVCTRFDLFVELTDGSQDDACARQQPLPKDLFSSTGGSAAYGGPQKEDGSIRFYGENFLMSTSQNSKIEHDIIQFKVLEDSVFRVFSQPQYEGSDIDFVIYRGDIQNISNVVGFFFGQDQVESGSISLAKSHETFSLMISYFEVPEVPCPFYHLEIAMKPRSVVAQSVDCSNEGGQFGYLPSSFEIIHNKTLSYFDDNLRLYVFRGTDESGFDYVKNVTFKVKSNVKVRMEVGFDFLLADFSLLLVNKEDNSVVSVGRYEGSINRGSYVNFLNIIATQLSYGTYVIMIRSKVHRLDKDKTQCHKYMFSIQAIADDGPVIYSVNPPGGRELNWQEDLIVSLYFSQPVSSPEPSSLTTADAISLRRIQTDPLLPNDASYNKDKTSIRAIFKASNFKSGQVFSLHIDPNAFKNKEGISFEMESGDYYFFMSYCDCHGNGKCMNSTSGTLECKCNSPFSGPSCLDCLPGYHHVGMACVPDVKCTENSCNGHGQCGDSLGYPSCTCDTGYATIGDDFCAGCARGYTGYPDCKPMDASEERDVTCYAPLLPNSLDDFSYKGDIHLQDWYFLDLNHYTHQMGFTLAETSVFRAYVGVHFVDVDIRLYQIDSNGLAILIEKSIAYGGEEVIYRVLTGKKDLTHYRIDFNYYLWDAPSKKMDCEVFDFELAISSLHSVVAHAPQSDKCASQDNLAPLISEPFVVGKNGYHFQSKAPAVRVAKADATSWSKYFYSVNFTIAEIPDNHEARLRATIDYRFLHGQLGLLLQEGNDYSHCGDNEEQPSPCVSGVNSYNQNFIDVTLSPGSYRLWIYEPTAQNASIAKCSLFGLSVSITFEEKKESIYSCAASRLPDTFNSQQYLSVDGYMHLQDDFYIDISQKKHIIKLSLARPSLFRVFIPEYKIDIDVLIYAAGQHDTPIAKADNFLKDEVIFQELPAGDYDIIFEYYIPLWITPSSLSFCATFPMEIALAPVNMPYPTETCKGGNDILPSFTTITAPFEFGMTPETNYSLPFYTYEVNQKIPRRVVTSFTVLATESAYLTAGVSSDFLRGDMILSIKSNTSSKETFGKHVKNHNFLEVKLSPGEYKLSIIQVTPLHTSTPPCLEFNFQVKMVNEISSTDVCSSQGYEIPRKINNIRYLGLDQRFHIQSDKFLIPAMTYYTTRTIQMSVQKPSLFRIYTEPHDIDIDLKLYNNGASRAYSDLVSSAISFNDEESVVYTLQPNVLYELDIMFYRWSTNIIKCSTFNMELSVAPLSSSPLPPMCPNNGGDHWPPQSIFKELSANGKVSYDDTTANEYLYVQQTRTGKSKQYQFSIDGEISLFAEVGYNFLFGDMVLRLSGSGLAREIVGDNYQDRNRLIVRELPPGNYTFTIDEPALNADTEFGCSFFTFTISAEQETLYDGMGDAGTHPVLPATLDSVGFLQYDSSVHLQGDYLIPYGKSIIMIPFTLTEGSLVRIYIEPHRYDLDLFIVNTEKNDVVATSVSMYQEESILQELSGGKYAFKITVLPSKDGFVPMKGGTNSFNMEIAIFPMKAISFPPTVTCTDSKVPDVTPNPQGLFVQRRINQSISPNKLVTERLVQKIPFELKTRSRIYARIGYDFLFNDLSLELTGPTTNFTGQNGKNFNEVDEIIEPGKYTLHIYQPSLMINQLKHCAEYSYEMKIRSSTSQPSVCQVYDLLPWDLNSERGGSSQFGGPIDVDGELHLFGDQFIMTENLVEHMSMEVKHNSFLRVYARPNSRYSIIRFNIDSNNSTVPPKTLDQVSNEVSLLYHLTPPADKRSFNLNFIHEKISSTRDACPYFTSQILLRKETTITQQLTCPQPLPKYSFPIQDIKPNNLGYAHESLSVVIPASALNSKRENGVFKYAVNITVTERSYLDVVAGFDYFANNFKLTLKNKWGFTVNNGMDSPQAQRSGVTNFNVAIHHIMFPGMYTLELYENTKSDVLSFHSGACIPFVWNLQVAPVTPTPHVREVLPPGGYELSTETETIVDISVTSEMHNKDGTLIESEDSSLLSSFYMELSGGGQKIYPTQVTISPEKLKITLKFASKLFKPAQTYSLKLSPGQLYDENSRELVLASEHKYSFMDNRCGDHGHMGPGFICICDDGWLGRHCEIDASRICGEHGHVKNNMCVCDIGYDGDVCEVCAKGYYKDSKSGKCVKGKICPDCGDHGQCNGVTGTCMCEALFQGPTCSECIPGHSGDDCQTRVVDNGKQPSSRHLKSIAIVLTVALIVAAVFLIVKKRPEVIPYQFFMLPQDDGERDVEMSRLRDSDEEEGNGHGGNSSDEDEFSFATQPSRNHRDSNRYGRR